MITSPCIGSCRLDPATQLCGGCARSGPEIAAWKDTSDAVRVRIWADLPTRRARLGIGVHRLGWTPDAILDYIVASLKADQGAWTATSAGVSIRFALGSAGPGTIDRHDATISAATAAGAIRFTITDRTRVLALPTRGNGADPTREPIILAVPRGQPSPSPAVGLTPIGADRAAIRPADRADRLYNLGLVGAAGVCIRTADSDLAAALDRRSGHDWASLRRDLGNRPTWGALSWIVANPVTRLELFSPADPLDHGGEQTPGIDLPDSFLPCAGFDPMPAHAR